MTRLLVRAARRARATEPERGDTLIEVLVAVAILGIAFVAILAGLGTAINLSGRQRAHASADVILVSAAESVRNQAYVPCATIASYAPLSGVPTLPDGWVAANITIPLEGVKYRDGAAWATTCTTDQNVQMVTITATSTDGRSSESIDIVKRKP